MNPNNQGKRMQRNDPTLLKRMEVEYDSRMEEQVDDLREKMRLLRKFSYIASSKHLSEPDIDSVEVDRKTNVELLESNKNSNKDFIRQLKQENKELRKEIADMKRVRVQFTIFMIYDINIFFV